MSPRIQSGLRELLALQEGQSALQYVLIVAPLVAAIALGAVTIIMSVS